MDRKYFLLIHVFYGVSFSLSLPLIIAVITMRKKRMKYSKLQLECETQNELKSCETRSRKKKAALPHTAVYIVHCRMVFYTRDRLQHADCILHATSFKFGDDIDAAFVA